MQDGAEQVRVDTDDQDVVRLSGRLTLGRIGDLPERLADLDTPPKAIDISQVIHMDTVGAWIVYKLARDSGATIEGASAQSEGLLTEVQNADQGVKIRPEQNNPFMRMLDEVGTSVYGATTNFIGMIGFLGATILGILGLIAHPSRFRVNAMVSQFKAVGVDALGIIGLMSFLIGVVIAQQGATQLELFGMEMFTINLVGRSSMRELGVLMTAIMVAGRSGSAFAAQLGTMKLTEEVDAMRTIGVSPMEALILPRVLASIVMMPLLGFYAGIAALFGGMVFCWAGLGIPPLTYVQRIQEVVPLTDVLIGLIKAPVFGAIVAIAGCYNGMQVKDNAEQVGQRTTDAVVQGIFLVIVLDAFFAVFFTSLGWK